MDKEKTGDFERLTYTTGGMVKIKINRYRMAVPGGWLMFSDLSITMHNASGPMVFIPDPDHKWDGAPLKL